MFKKIMIAVAALTMATPALAERETRVLYMEVDQGQELMGRHSQAFQRIFDHTGNFLNHEHIRLFEEGKRQNTGKRSFREALDIAAQAKRKRLDAVVLVSVKHKTDQQGAKIKDRMVAIAKIVDAQTLEVVDTIRVQSPVAKIRKGDCKTECRDLVKRRHVREILPEFKNKLVQHILDYRPQSREVARLENSKLTLTLKGFKAREIRHLEDRIARLNTTKDLSTLRSRKDKPAFWLERRKNAGNVRDDLSKVLAQLDLNARIIQTERQVTLIKVNPELAYLN
jgi:hypothetical protein